MPPRGEKRKSKDESPSPVNGEPCIANASGIPISLSTAQTQSVVNPITGLNVQISTKKCKTASPCAISPVLLECPEQDCSKKYKHANGLKYHQSHAHGSSSMDEDSMQLPESPVRSQPPTTPSPAPPPPATTPQPTVTQITNAGSPPQTPGSVAVSTVTQTTATVVAGNGCSLETVAVAPPTPAPATIVTSGPPPVVSASANNSLINTVQSTTTTPSTGSGIPIQPSQQPQNPLTSTIPGGSITAGISAQAAQQQQQQQTHTSLLAQNSVLLGTANPVISNENVSNTALTPTRPVDVPCEFYLFHFG